MPAYISSSSTNVSQLAFDPDCSDDQLRLRVYELGLEGFDLIRVERGFYGSWVHCFMCHHTFFMPHEGNVPGICRNILIYGHCNGKDQTPCGSW